MFWSNTSQQYFKFKSIPLQVHKFSCFDKYFTYIAVLMNYSQIELFIVSVLLLYNFVIDTFLKIYTFITFYIKITVYCHIVIHIYHAYKLMGIVYPFHEIIAALIYDIL